MIIIAILLFLFLIGLTIGMVLINCLIWLFIVLGWADAVIKRLWMVLLGLIVSGSSVAMLMWLWPKVMLMFN